MKNLVKLAMPVAMALVTIACGGNKEQSSNREGEMVKESGMMHGQVNSILIKNSDLNAIYQHYVHLTNALVNDDIQEAQSAANAIEAGANELNAGNALARTAAKISSALTLEAQRESYQSLSDEMVRLVKNAGLESGEVYVQYCPMANDNKGASWLSSIKEIQNPYMGQKMLKCGESRETLH